jgi:hypothetical protein
VEATRREVRDPVPGKALALPLVLPLVCCYFFPNEGSTQAEVSLLNGQGKGTLFNSFNTFFQITLSIMKPLAVH